MRTLAPALALVLVVACAPAAPISPEPSGPAGEPVSAVANRDGIVLTLALETATPRSGESSRAIVTVLNTSSEPRRWQGGGCDFPATISVETAGEVVPAAGRVWQGTAGQFKTLLAPQPGPSRLGSYIDERFAEPAKVACAADLRLNSLASGGTLTMNAIWDGQVNGVAATPGPATVTAVFPYLGRPAGGGDLVNPSDSANAIGVQVRVDVAGPADRLLSPGEAIDAALGDPGFVGFLVASGPMSAWDGVDLEARDGAYVVILLAGGRAGRASVDRHTGVVAFQLGPR